MLVPRLSAIKPGFTLLEMVTTVAALVILLGLMVSLARRVRNASAVDLTKDLLRRLDVLMSQYEQHYGRLPDVVPLIDPHVAVDPDESSIQTRALENNRQVLAALRLEAGTSADAFDRLPSSIYDESALRDAWGSPIVYMSGMHPMIGMAPQNRRFFFSAGPDHLFLTQDDNLYSYEEGNSAERLGSRSVSAGGHPE